MKTKTKAPRTAQVRLTATTLERIRKEAERNGRTISGQAEWEITQALEARAAIAAR